MIFDYYMTIGSSVNGELIPNDDIMVGRVLGRRSYRRPSRTCTSSVEEGTVPSGLSLYFFIFFERCRVDFGDPRPTPFPLQREEQLSPSSGDENSDESALFHTCVTLFICSCKTL